MNPMMVYGNLEYSTMYIHIHYVPSLSIAVFTQVFFCCFVRWLWKSICVYGNCIFKAHANGKFELWYSSEGERERERENALLLFANQIQHA